MSTGSRLAVDGIFELRWEHPAPVLHVLSVRGRESISRPYRIDARVRAGAMETAALRSLLGVRATLSVHGDGGTRMVTGVITAVASSNRAREGITLRVRIAPRLQLLDEVRRTRIFQERTGPEVLGALLAEHAIRHAVRLQRSYEPRPYCVQHRETDLDFFHRLLDESGLFYFFEPPGEPGEEGALVVCDATTELPELDPALLVVHDAELHHPERAVDPLRHDERVRTGRTEMRHVDFRRPHADLAVSASVGPTRAGLDEAQLAEWDDHAPWEDDPSSPLRARQLLDARRRDASTVASRGRFPLLSAGQRVWVEDPSADPSRTAYIVVRVVHEGRRQAEGAGGAHGESYRNRFTCVPAHVAPRRVPRRRRIESVESAVVVGPPGEEIHVDEHGRVKVQFAWDRIGRRDDRSSCWLRVAGPWAGPSWGFQAVPRVGMEVLVSFLSGDPDRPVISGCLYNGTAPPPFLLPRHKARSGLRTHSYPGGDGFNELSFDDSAGREQVYLRAQKDHEVAVLGDHQREVRGREHIRVGDAKSLEVGADFERRVGGNETVSVGGNFVLHVAGTTSIVVDGSGGRFDQGAAAAKLRLPMVPAGPPPRRAPTPRTPESFRAEQAALGARLVFFAAHAPAEDQEECERIAFESWRTGHEAAELHQRATELGPATASDAPVDPSRAAERGALLEDIQSKMAAVAAQQRELEHPAAPAGERATRTAAVTQLATAMAELHAASEVVAGETPADLELRGGGGGFDEDDAEVGEDKAIKPFYHPSTGEEIHPDGKGTLITLTNGGEIQGPQGLRLSSGGSFIELTPGGVVIGGPEVVIKGGPIRLNS